MINPYLLFLFKKKKLLFEKVLNCSDVLGDDIRAFCDFFEIFHYKNIDPSIGFLVG